MEDDSTRTLSDVEVSDHMKNGVVSPIMAKFSDGNNEVKQVELPKVNGNCTTDNKVLENDSYSSESDALVIDESTPKIAEHLDKRCINNIGVSESYKSTDIPTHSNPFFNESLFELSQLHHKYQNGEEQLKDSTDKTILEKHLKHRKVKNKHKTKLQDYAQYLGLQPAIQFKCSKCSRAGFETLTALQEHASDCNEENLQEIVKENLSSGFKLTRKVFLCSACGTYYENWNLYMHMLEIHQRYICLYCLGMFSVLEDLCQHLQLKHNLEPGYKNTPDDFFHTYNEPCYVVCCECNKLFSEQDNFFYHNCSKNFLKCKKTVKPQITPENHVTGESEAIYEAVQKCNSEIELNDENNATDILKTQEIGISMETICENLISNDKNLNEITDVDKGLDNISLKSMERDKNSIDDSDNVEDNSRFSDGDRKLEIPAEENNFLKEYSDYRDDMEETQELLHSSQIVSNDSEILPNEQLDTRKVPKLSLKLPKQHVYSESAEESDDSEKLTMDQCESEMENDQESSKEKEIGNNSPDVENHERYEDNNDEITQEFENKPNEIIGQLALGSKDQIQVAGPDVQIVELVLEQPLDKFDPCTLLQKCLKTTVDCCIYCNHARKISVNGKQLALHCIAEHRFSAVVNSITAEELIPESFVSRLTESLTELETLFFSLELGFSSEAVTFSHLFECFQCYFSTTVHKELYLHNRKFHSKNLLLCIMCKSNFYSYSELICHLCPGLYVLDYDLQFRCCMCVNDDLPSSFRLMVHLRKKHNVCDVCMEMCHSQYRLSNHVWKHKLHHFCYRCGIAYRNKPDITRHLFWKHGTESVMCKKCLQKKWPHVYHFCVPPINFTCDECGSSFTKAVSLKVHKRLHTGQKDHHCTYEGCSEKFISNKLRLKHEKKHLEPAEDPIPDLSPKQSEEQTTETLVEEKETVEGREDTLEDKPKPKVDVLDLPALNLSESDSSDSENENLNPSTSEILQEEFDALQEIDVKDEKMTVSNNDNLEQDIKENTDVDLGEKNVEVNKQNETERFIEQGGEFDSSNSVIQNIWDNFKNYQASKEKLDNLFSESEKTESHIEEVTETEVLLTPELALRDHDYCLNSEQKTDSSIIEVKPALAESVDHDYCSPKVQETMEKIDPNKEQFEIDTNNEQKQDKEDKKVKNTSSSSSGSDSSSCSCGSNCSCSSSSGSSSSSSQSSNSDSSTEEGRKRQQLARKQRRKDRAKKIKQQEKTAASKIVNVEKSNEQSAPTPISIEAPIRESDLETTESETDEEFYDKAPQKLARKILEEKRQQLLSIMGPNNVPIGSFIESTSRPPTPPAGEEVEEDERKKRKNKSKKRKKHKNEKKLMLQESSDLTSLDVPIPPYYQQFHQTFNQSHHEPAPSVAPITVSLSRNSPVITTPSVLTTPISSLPKEQTESATSKQEPTDTTLRASKRRRVPNKFYGYSSDEDQEKGPVAKLKKTEAPLPRSPLTVPPITIKTTPQPPPPPAQTVEPISIRTGAHLSDFRVQRPRPRPPNIPPIKLLSRRGNDDDSGTDSNDSSSEEQGILPIKPSQPQLYCYCRCPYDEVSEMIGCDASDCAIEWFHFECVGIMVPPKGQWFCPDCRKKKQQRRDFFQQQQNRLHTLGNQQST